MIIVLPPIEDIQEQFPCIIASVRAVAYLRERLVLVYVSATHDFHVDVPFQRVWYENILEWYEAEGDLFADVSVFGKPAGAISAFCDRICGSAFEEEVALLLPSCYWSQPTLYAAVERDLFDLHLLSATSAHHWPLKVKEACNPRLDSLPETGPYKTVLLAGTFDGLHAGHKLLLSATRFLATDKIVIGITSEEMLTKKANKELIESWNVRARNVEAFVKAASSTAIQETYAVITDPIGLAGTRDDLDCIVATDETHEGARLVNAARQERGLPSLEIVVVKTLNKHGAVAKLSSSDTRRAFSAARCSVAWQDLRSRWMVTAESVGVLYSDAGDAWTELCAVMSQPWRLFHGFSRLQDLLLALSDCWTLAEDPVALELAVWFHLWHFDPASSLSSKRSAAKFRRFASQAESFGRTPTRAEAIGRCILLAASTAGAALLLLSSELSPDERLLLEIVCAVLASDAESFQLYVSAVEKENSHVPAETFAAERAELLRPAVEAAAQGTLFQRFPHLNAAAVRNAEVQRNERQARAAVLG